MLVSAKSKNALASSTEALSRAQSHEQSYPPPNQNQRVQTFTVPSLKRRMACWIYEGVLLFGVVFIAGYLFSTLSQTKNAMDNRHALQAFIFLVFGIYFVWLWRHGQTLAMKTWKLRITNLEGKPITTQQAVMRYVLSWMWFVPPLAFSNFNGLKGLSSLGVLCLWVLLWSISSKLNPTKQFWQDAWAKTKIIKIPDADTINPVES
jgi:uncharacterized RDD family membrane protein YckC